MKIKEKKEVFSKPTRVNAFALFTGKDSINIDFYISYEIRPNKKTDKSQETIQIAITVHEDLSLNYMVMSTEEDIMKTNVYLLSSGGGIKYNKNADVVMEEIENKIEYFFKSRHNLNVKIDGLLNIDRILINKNYYFIESREIFYRFILSQTKIKILESCYYD